MEKAEAEERITDVAYDPNIGVETWWDLGLYSPNPTRS